MADDNNESTASTAPTIVERWLAEQNAWQKTMLEYMDSMVHNDEFLVHLGNAMRGSLLAGKAYPTQPPPGASEPLNETDDRIDEILHTLHLIQGELRDLRAAVERTSRRQSAVRTRAAAGTRRGKSKKAKKSTAARGKAGSARGGDAD